jgi:hypothetical protein
MYECFQEMLELYANAPGLADMLGYKRQQSQVPRPFYGRSQGALVLGAGSAFPSWRYLSSIGYIRSQYRRVFIIYVHHFVPAKETDLTLGYISSPTRSSPGISRLCHPALYIILKIYCLS